MNNTNTTGETKKHHKLCNPIRHAQRDIAFGYKTLCDGNRACPKCADGVAYPLVLNFKKENERVVYSCQPCYEAKKWEAEAR